MRNVYQKLFAENSPFFIILMILVVLGSYSVRTKIDIPINSISTHADFLSKFAIPETVVKASPEIYFKIELLLHIGMIILVYFLGKEIAGRTQGLFISTFIAFYPYFIANCYNVSNYFWIFFLLYLFFQLRALFTLYKKWALFAGIFFILAVVSNPVCLFLVLVPYIYYLIKAKNIAIFHNLLFFLLGALVTLSPFMLYVLTNNKEFSYIIPFATTFKPFINNFNVFLSNPLSYFTDDIIPFITNIAHPNHYNGLSSYTYLHYIIITLAILGILYSLIEERIRVIFLIFLVLLIQAFFMPVNFGILFIFIIFMASYMIDKVFHDVFC